MDKIKQLLHRLRQQVSGLLHKEQTVENNQAPILYTEEQLMARLKFFIGICLSLTLFGIVFVVLYSLIFVTQPLNAISPIDQKFFELIVPIATFLTGTLSGIMLAGGDKDAQKQALAAANKGWDRPPAPINTGGSANGGFGSSSSGASTFGAPASGGFGSSSSGFGSPATSMATAPGGFGGSGFGGAPTAPAFGGGFGAPAPVATTASGKAIVPDFPQPEI
jgi:uncharacterized membrane protein YgcG